MKKNSADYYYQAISDKRIRVVSFDVFDTLLLRPFLYPADLFFFLDREISARLNIPDVVDFSSYRREAESALRKEKQASGCEDITLNEIYGYISGHYPFPEETVRELETAEINLEKQMCSARKFGVGLLRHALAQGKRVIITTDMYLSSAVIGSLLEKNGISGYEKIYVSGETRVTKHTGTMFDYIARETGVPGRQILHIGDNLYSDVKVPRKHGWKALPLYRPVDLLQNRICGVRTGDAFWHSFKSMCSSQSAYHALDYSGLRCMLAVAANRVFDDPFSIRIRKGDYSGSAELFGNLALGMYVVAQGLWIARIAAEEKADRVLFFSRDGWLVYQAYEYLRKQVSLPEAHYVHASRKSLYPLLLTSKEHLLTSGAHIRFESHSRETITGILMPVLDDEAIRAIKEEKAEIWTDRFSSETELLLYLNEIREKALDNKKASDYRRGFCRCFEPYMQGNVLCCDVGYSVRNESLLRSMFPDTKITAAFTHTSKDIPIRRAQQGNITIRTFNNVSPYVSWLVREVFLTSDEPSCVGYSASGEPVYEKQRPRPVVIGTFQEEAVRYVRALVDVFQQDVVRLPLELEDACLPFEAFLHSPCYSDLKWLGELYAENEADPQITDREVLIFWKKLRTEYLIASRRTGRFGRHVVRFLMLLSADRKELKHLIRERLG